MRDKFKISLAAAAVCLVGFAGSANASTVIDGSCKSVTDAAGCLFSGNINNNAMNQNGYVAAQNAYNLYNNTHPDANPDITLNYLADTDGDFGGGSLTGAGGSSGTWSLPGYLVDFVAVKAADYFVLYQIDPASSGTWDTLDIPFKKNPHDLSHLLFFGSPTGAVPEPATWGMMILGLGLIGGVMRRRQRTAVTYAF